MANSKDNNQYYCFFNHYKPGLLTSCKVCDHLYRELLDSQQEANMSMAGSEYGAVPDNALADIGEPKAASKLNDEIPDTKDEKKRVKKFLLVPKIKPLNFLDNERADALNSRVVMAADKAMAQIKSALKHKASIMEYAVNQVEGPCNDKNIKNQHLSMKSTLPADRPLIVPAKFTINSKLWLVREESVELKQNNVVGTEDQTIT